MRLLIAAIACSLSFEAIAGDFTCSLEPGAAQPKFDDLRQQVAPRLAPRFLRCNGAHPAICEYETDYDVRVWVFGPREDASADRVKIVCETINDTCARTVYVALHAVDCHMPEDRAVKLVQMLMIARRDHEKPTWTELGMSAAFTIARDGAAGATIDIMPR